MTLLVEGDVTFESTGAFYNPRMKLNRDIGVAMAKALGLEDYLDALSASGIRGLRVAKESRVDSVTLNDVSLQACQLIHKNLARNGLSCEVTCSNANVLLHERHFETVDLDPFGSPSPYLSAASRSALSYLFMTATDTAPLCGSHLKSGIRKYMSHPVCTDYHREMGARILLGLAARELSRLDKGCRPILTHVTDHYVRTYLRVIKGAKEADKSLENIGYVEHCMDCGSFRTIGDPRPAGACGYCQSKTILAGPLWLGKIQDPEIIGLVLDRLESAPRGAKLLLACKAEVDVPFYYDHHSLCEKLNITPGKIDDVVERLLKGGRKASRTHFCGLGIKTDAPMSEVLDAIKTT